jgi:hypothetical protein
VALADEEATVVWILGTDVNGERRLVVAPVRRGDGGGESEQSGERARVGEKGGDWPCGGRGRDRVTGLPG